MLIIMITMIVNNDNRRKIVVEVPAERSESGLVSTITTRFRGLAVAFHLSNNSVCRDFAVLMWLAVEASTTK